MNSVKRTGRSPDLTKHGIVQPEVVWWNLPPAALVEHAIQRREGHLALGGPLVVRTGEYTGRSPNDRFFVKEPGTARRIAWGEENRPFDPRQYEALRARFMTYLKGQEIFVQDGYAGADPDQRLPIRVITEMAWQSLFARNMFRPETDPDRLARHAPAFTVLSAPGFHSRPDMDGTRSEVFILIHFGRKEVLIGGTLYAGEIKKSIFTVMNFLLPRRGVLPMHCSAVYGKDQNDVAVLFGLSGTGKTSLSADPEQTLVGDDEHGWSDRGIFNFEGGCYAKTIRLSAESEPEIFRTTRMFGTILENVAMDMTTRELDLFDDTLTENSRGSYPLSHIPRASANGSVGHARNIVLLAADAFGVLPPISRLSPEQAMYHFLSGYTAKVAGTERGIDAPKATFSACFGAPFMPLPPSVYANLLGEKVTRHKSRVWLLNTGWTGGGYGTGSRIRIEYSRAMLRAALTGKLDRVPMRKDPVFGVRIPRACPDVPAEVLDPRTTWKDRGAYDERARTLASMFAENFSRYGKDVPAAVREAGPATSG